MNENVPAMKRGFYHLITTNLCSWTYIGAHEGFHQHALSHGENENNSHESDDISNTT